MIASFPHLKLADVRVPLDGEYVIVTAGLVIKACGFGGIYPIIETDNAYSVWNLEDLNIPEGHEPDGESLKDAFRVPSPGGIAIHASDGTAMVYQGRPNGPDERRLCLRKIAPKTKRVAVLETDNPDVVHLYEGKTVSACGTWAVRIEERPL